MIKKYVLFLTIGLTLSGNVNATTSRNYQEIENTLDALETNPNHTIAISRLREDNHFKSSATALLKNKEKSAEEIIYGAFKENLSTYIDEMLNNDRYWNIVERGTVLYTYLKNKYEPAV